MKRILVIDDESLIRETIRAVLRREGYEVIDADSGPAGIELARSQHPDLVVCDVRMANVDGYLTLSAMRADPTTAAIPFILMTGLADNAGMRLGMELGADDYLSKPFTNAELCAAVATRLKKAQVVQDVAEQSLADLRDNLSTMLPHEMRTPLNGILAYGELLSTDAALLTQDQIAKIGQTIHGSGKRLERLIENFLIYSQIEMLHTDAPGRSALRRECTLHPRILVEASTGRQAEAFNRQEHITLDLADHPVAISEQHLTKIVDELTHNAFRFSDAGTPVTVALRASGTTLILSITDRGCGLTPEQVRKVGAYMQFDRKKREQQGLGLGLVIAKRLTELHGGNLSIQSAVGTGTTVSVALPVALNAAAATLSAPPTLA